MSTQGTGTTMGGRRPSEWAAHEARRRGSGINTWTLFCAEYFEKHPTTEFQPKRPRREYKAIKDDPQQWELLKARAQGARLRCQEDLKAPVVVHKKQRVRAASSSQADSPTPLAALELQQPQALVPAPDRPPHGAFSAARFASMQSKD